MSETLRDLVVSLSLQTDNFTRNIKSVNKQIQEAESYFKLAKAGEEDFEKTTEGLSSQLATLERKLSLQKDVVDQYQRALAAAQEKLEECRDRQVDYAQRLEDAKLKQNALNKQVELAAAAYEEYVAELGESDEATVQAKAHLDEVQGKYKVAGDEVKKLAGQNEALKKATLNAADAVSTATSNLNKAQAAVKQTEAEIATCNQSLRLAHTEWDAAGKAIADSKTVLTSIGKQLSLAESRYKLATAGIKNMDKSVEGLSAKLTLLREKLDLQQQSVTQYEKALAAARQQLQAAQEANDPQKIQQATDAVIDAEAALNRAKAAVKETEAEIEDCNRALKTAQSQWTATGEALETFSKRCDSVGKNAEKVGKVLTKSVTTPIVALGTAAVTASIEFESSFASVRKTVEATEDEFAQLAAGSKKMSTQVAASTSEINEVMATGGQLGIATKNLEKFTRVMIDLGNSSEDLNANEAATALAKFANIMDTDQSLFENMGSTVVDLGNNFATTEAAIVNMAMRLAGAGKQVGLSEAQIMGFAAALSSVGIEAQMGGSAFSKALVKMEVAAETGGEALEDFAKVSGMTAQQFKALWKSDPAGAFQAFITGLAKLDDEGESAIATLNEIGITEIRLRDTMLRATNATELFSRAQTTATKAWEENTALAEEAGKRYATTESKLKNLKNTAILFAQRIGDDMNPTIQKWIEGANSLLDKFMDLDAAQRKQIIQYAAVAAAAGPAILVFGKVAKGVGTVTSNIGKFATAVGQAGGGFSGFFSVLSKSPAVWLAVAAAAVTATVAIVDYASGAKKAREALEGMKKTAEEWKNTAAETFYGKGGLSAFGMSKDDFVRDGTAQSAQEWLNGLLVVWTDGKKETNEIVAEWTDSFKALTESTREELKKLKSTADEAGYAGVSAQIQTDIDALDAMDAEITKLLKKRQSKLFTEQDQIRLQELIDTREAIEVKYRLTPADVDGFDTIRQKVEAEVARAQARGLTDADVSVYENAMVAAAEGMAAVNQAIDAQYDKEYAVIQLIEDSAERQAAMEALNANYTEDRRAAAQEYAETMAAVVMPVWNQEDIQAADSAIDALYSKLREYSIAANNGDALGMAQALKDMEALTSSMDEGALTEYVALLTQIQSLMDAGMTEEEVQSLFPDLDVSQQMSQIASLTAFVKDHKDTLEGLSGIFTDAVPEEVLKIATDLDMTGAQARWEEFASNPGAITTQAIIDGYAEAEEIKKLQPTVDAFISAYTEIPEGADTSQLTPEGLLAYVEKYAEVTTGADVSGLTPENVTAMVSAYQELAAGADVSLLKPDEITAYISQYLEQNGVDTSGLTPEGITAFVMAYEEVTGGASTNMLTPPDVAAIITGYLMDANVDISKLSPPQIDALVTAYAEATGCDKSSLKAEVEAQITAYVEANGIQKPSYIEAQIGVIGYDLAAYNAFVANNPVTVKGVVRVGEMYDNPEDLLNDPKARFYEDGKEIPVNLVPANKIDASTLMAYDDDGTLHVLITPEIEGTAESVARAAEGITSKYVTTSIFGNTSQHDLGWLNNLVGGSLLDWMRGFNTELEAFKRNEGTWLTLWGLLDGATLSGIDKRMGEQFSGENLANLSAYVAEIVAAIQSGAQVSEQDLGNLQEIVGFLNNLELTNTGENILAGIGQAMTEAGWESDATTVASNLQDALDKAIALNDMGANVQAGIGAGMTEASWDDDAETVASNLEGALNEALDIHSPSERMKPIGGYAAAGIGAGMTEYDLSTDAQTFAANVEAGIAAALTADTLSGVGTTASQGLALALVAYSMASAGNSVSANVKSAISASLNSSTLRSTGVNAMEGLKAGINAGRSGVISAMRSAAQAAVSAAKSELKIKSPSRVFRDEVGRMTMKGFGEGVLRETKEQAKAIRNAARYLTGEAKEGSIAYNSSDNSRTYNQQSSVNLSGNNFYIRDEKDAYALAVEIASLTRRQQRGRGLRMA